MMTVSTRRNLSDGEPMGDPDAAATQDLLWLGASAPDGSLRTVASGQRRGTAITTLDVPAGLALADGGPGVRLLVVGLGSEQAAGLDDPEAVRTLLDAVAPDGAVGLVAEGAEQTRLLAELLARWPAGWSLEHVAAERGAVSATLRRGAPDALIDQGSAADQLWAALDRVAGALHERDQEARVIAHRLALRHRQLEAATAREAEGATREDELLDEITQLRALVRLERKGRDRAEKAAEVAKAERAAAKAAAKAATQELERRLSRRAARLGRRVLRRA